MRNRSSTHHTKDVRAIGAAVLVALGLMLASSPVVLSTAASKHPSNPTPAVSWSKAVAVSWDSCRFRFEHEAEHSA
jgi:hypothetical protein